MTLPAPITAEEPSSARALGPPSLFFNPPEPSPETPLPPPPPPAPTGVNLPVKTLYGSYTAGQGIGYPTGYSTFGTFVSTSTTPRRAYPFLDLRGHYLNNNTWAANAGIGARFILPSSCTVVGANAYYDFRQKERANYNQVGFGVELIGKWINLQINAYIPVGKSNQATKNVYKDYIGPYRVTCIRNDFAFTSSNAEFGFYLFQTSGLSLYAAGGPYYLSGKNGNSAFGATGRLEAQFSDIVSVAFITSHDHLFGTLYQGEFTLTFPLYRFSPKKGASSSGCTLNNRQLYQRVRRNEIIPTSVESCYFSNFKN
ncbi:MAG: inverse autotransporter beta domain-containing protein [Verrucomicrobia bacterium]|nr:inverse autotransporter beta domain-containing protein [Verrucomicrobiota bacterium]